MLKRIKGKIKFLSFIYNLPHLLQFFTKFPFKYFKILKIIKNYNHKRIIAISLTRRFGDIVACEPISRNIRKSNPNAFIIWFTENKYASLIINNPNIDLVFNVFCLSEWILFSRLIKFDAICDFHFQGRKCCFLPLKKKIGNKNISHENYYNYGNLLNIFSLVSGYKPVDKYPYFYNIEKNSDFLNELDLPMHFITIHNQSGSKQRNWEIKKWISLIEYITSALDVYVVEIGLESKLNIQSSNMYLNLCGRLSILNSAEIIKRSFLYIGLDSGPAHIANAVGTYGIILLGDYNHFRNYQPFSGNYETKSKVHLIRSNDRVTSIAIETVKGAVMNYINENYSP